MGIATFPYILPTGTLFAPTGNRIVNHVVFCLLLEILNHWKKLKAISCLVP
jgi:hypothetical protein